MLGRVEVDPYQVPSGSLASDQTPTPYQKANPDPSLALDTIQSLNDDFTINVKKSWSDISGPSTSTITNNNASTNYTDFFTQLSQAVNSNTTYVYYSGTTNGQINESGTLYSQADMFTNFGGSGSYSIGLTESGFSGSSDSIENGFDDAQKAIKLIAANSGATSTTDYWSINTTLGQYEPSYNLSSHGWMTAAAVASVGLGANLAGDGTYPQATQDSSGTSLSINDDYTIDFSNSGLPPVGSLGSWSVTVYGDDNYLVPPSTYVDDANYYITSSSYPDLTAASGVYALGSEQLSYLDTSDLTLNLSQAAPTNQQFWIPTPTSGDTFNVVLRLYDPTPASSDADASILSSSNPWTPPGIELMSTTTNGLISGSKVFLDADNDHLHAGDESALLTNENGQYVKSKLDGDGILILEGGREKTTGIHYLGRLFARDETEVISPLTTLEWAMERRGVSENDRNQTIAILTQEASQYLSDETDGSSDASVVDLPYELFDPRAIAPHQIARQDLPNSDVIANAHALLNSMFGLLLTHFYSRTILTSDSASEDDSDGVHAYAELVDELSMIVVDYIDQQIASSQGIDYAEMFDVLVDSLSLRSYGVAGALSELAGYAKSIATEPYDSFSERISNYKVLEAYGDYEDLELRIMHSLDAVGAGSAAMARLQVESSDAILDLTDIPNDGSLLSMSILTHADYTNRLGLVQLEGDAVTGYSVAGVDAGNTDAFRSAVRDNLINPGPLALSAGGISDRTATWSLSSQDSGIYAAVLINPNGEVFTFGATASDGQQHVKVLGDNTFAFEDLLASQASDWDFNDMQIQFTIA